MNCYNPFLLFILAISITDTLGIRLEKHDMFDENMHLSDGATAEESACELKQEGDVCIGEVAKISNSINLGVILNIETEFYISNNELIEQDDKNIEENDGRYLEKNFDLIEDANFTNDEYVGLKRNIEETSGANNSTYEIGENVNNDNSGFYSIEVGNNTSNKTISKIIYPTANHTKNEIKNYYYDENVTLINDSETLKINDNENSAEIPKLNENMSNETINNSNLDCKIGKSTDNCSQLNSETANDNTENMEVGLYDNGLSKKVINNYRDDLKKNVLEAEETYFLNQTITTNMTIQECLNNSLITYNITSNGATGYLLIIKKEEVILVNVILHEHAPTIGHDSGISRLPLLLEVTSNDISKNSEDKTINRDKENRNMQKNQPLGNKAGTNYVESISIFRFPREFPTLTGGERGSIEINLIQTNVSFYASIRVSVISKPMNETLRLSTILITSSIGVEHANEVFVNKEKDVKLTSTSFRLKQSEEFLEKNNPFINPNYEITKHPMQKSFLKSIFTSETSNKK